MKINQKSQFATETYLPEGRIEIKGARSRSKILIEPGPTVSWQGALMYLSGLPRSLNATVNQRFGGRWDPLTRRWSIPKAKAVALRAYLAERL